MLLIQPEPFSDESLESYLLRLCYKNMLEYQFLIEWAADRLAEADVPLEGALPSDLTKVNLCYSYRTSTARFVGLEYLATLAEKDPHPFQTLALYRSSTTLSGYFSCVFRKGIDIPRVFIRDCIPICPHCLNENEYIQQNWHFTPIRACQKHHCELIFDCPECGKSLNYMRSRKILKCECSFKLSDSPIKSATNASIQISQALSETSKTKVDNILLSQSRTVIWAGILWWKIHHQENNHNYQFTDSELAQLIEYFNHWPDRFFTELTETIDNNLYSSIQPLHDLKFRDVFGNLLINSCRLPLSTLTDNFILSALFKYIDQYVHTNKTSKLNLIQLNAIESSILLCTTPEQVFQLAEDGRLKKAKQKLIRNNYAPQFRLGEVFTRWLACHQSNHSNRHIYLSRW